MADLKKYSIQELMTGLRAGDFSSREVTSYFLDRIETLEGQVHAFLSLKPEQALQQAERADAVYVAWRAEGRQSSLPALLGLPIAVKDVLCVDGFPCTCGSRILQDFHPPFNATSVQHLLDAGVVIVGKTNMDEFAMGSSTENSAFGPTRNPWNLAHVPGGSSGGSAAAVAAHMIPAALATDTGGSVRQPASFCGVTGVKPTYGRVSRFGLIAYGSSLDTAGVMAHNAQDVEALLRIMAGFDPRDATTSDLPVFDPAPRESDLKGLRIGLPLEYFIEGIQPEVEMAVKEAVRLLEEHGAQVVQVSLPHTRYALPVYYLIAPAEASANLARFDGVRYGLRVEDEDLIPMYSKTRGKGFGAEVKRRIMLGTYALSAGYYDAYYGQAQKVRTLIKQDFEKAFEIVDVIAAPIAPTTAFKLGQHTDDPLAMYLEDVFTLPANLAGVPGLAFPVGFDGDGLPIGMQLMGPQFSEQVLFKTANVYQSFTDFHRRIPLSVQ